jgi:hypothetical protein
MPSIDRRHGFAVRSGKLETPAENGGAFSQKSDYRNFGLA